MTEKDMDYETDGEGEYEIEKITDSRWYNGILYYRVKWAGYSDYWNSWEPRNNLTAASRLVAQYEAATLGQHHYNNNSSSMSPVINVSVDEIEHLDTGQLPEQFSLRLMPGEQLQRAIVANENCSEVVGRFPTEILFSLVPASALANNQTPTVPMEFCVRFADGGPDGLLTRDVVLNYCPDLLIEFYEKHIYWQ